MGIFFKKVLEMRKNGRNFVEGKKPETVKVKRNVTVKAELKEPIPEMETPVEKPVKKSKKGGAKNDSTTD